MKNSARVVIFLHGLLGDKQDWHKVITHLEKQAPSLKCIAIDLPFHGENKQKEIENFAMARAFLAKELQQKVGDAPYWLVGYSLGGRLTLDFLLNETEYLAQNVKKNLQGVILEGANFGLAT